MTKGDQKNQSSRRGHKERTLITNNAAVLSLLAKHPRINAWEISREGGITERSIRLNPK